MDPYFGEHHHHLYHHHLGFTGLHETFQWLPLLAGMLVTIAVAWILLILLGGDRFQQNQPASGLPSIPNPVRQRWHGTVRSHAATAQQFAAYECSPAAVAQRPDLADVTRPATALFIDAFAEANALATKHYPGTEHAEQFIQAAQRAQRAWQTAVDTARHSGLSRSTADQRVLLNQTLAPLAVPQDDPHEGGRRNAHQRTQYRLVTPRTAPGLDPYRARAATVRKPRPTTCVDRPPRIGRRVIAAPGIDRR
jgi:hypothetical protein